MLKQAAPSGGTLMYSPLMYSVIMYPDEFEALQELIAERVVARKAKEPEPAPKPAGYCGVCGVFGHDGGDPECPGPQKFETDSEPEVAK